MPTYLDVETWPRRALFEFYRDFDKPYFNVCLRLDVTNLRRELRNHPGVSVSLTYHYLALRAANEIEQFRYRLRDGKVLVHEVINGGTTLMLPNETFTLVYFDYKNSFAEFMKDATRAVEEMRRNPTFEPRHEDDARIHCTTLPWISFTSFSHARNWRSEDSVPKISFGKFTEENGRTLMPFSVEVHHALVDGLHVGRYIARIEEMLAQPEIFLNESLDA
jgi:chloramphenicol O-acetyltransferase type A